MYIYMYIGGIYKSLLFVTFTVYNKNNTENMNNISNIANHSEVSEKEIEKYLCRRVKDCGGICLKYSNSNMVGYPDREALFPGGLAIWFELKSKGRKPTKMQAIRHEQMAQLGHTVFVCDSKESIDSVLEDYGYGNF